MWNIGLRRVNNEKWVLTFFKPAYNASKNDIFCPLEKFLWYWEYENTSHATPFGHRAYILDII